MITEDNWYVGMKVMPGKDWIGESISGIGSINHTTHGSYQCGSCALEKDHSSLIGCNDVSPLWAIVTWPGDRIFCHRIGANGMFDLYRHVDGKILIENYVILNHDQSK